jgi:5-hydroxyisourate hydrolase-like protein (transthyretin family)
MKHNFSKTDANGMAKFERQATKQGSELMPSGVYQLVYSTQEYFIALGTFAKYGQAEVNVLKIRHYIIITCIQVTFAVKPWGSVNTIRVILDENSYSVYRSMNDDTNVRSRRHVSEQMFVKLK